MTTRPQLFLNGISKSYPKLNRRTNEILKDKNWQLPVFIPTQKWCDHVTQGNPNMTAKLVKDALILTAITSWQYSKGIYTFDDTLYDAVIDSKITGDLPSDILKRLPEWCIYVNTPNLTAFGQDIDGFFTYLDINNDGSHELRMLLDGHKQLINILLPLGKWDMVEAIEKYATQGKINAKKAGIAFDGANSQADYEHIAKEVTPFLSLLLYICSDNGEVKHHQTTKSTTTTKRKGRLYPAKDVKQYTIGKAMGDTLRHALSQDKGGLKAHVRRGHYHRYWIGSGKDKELSTRWIMPTIVRGSL